MPTWLIGQSPTCYHQRCAGYFLIKCTVRFFGEDNPTASVEALPDWEFFGRARDYSVVFNPWALQEIQRDRVDKCLAEIETRGANLRSINQTRHDPRHAPTFDQTRPLTMNRNFLDRLLEPVH